MLNQGECEWADTGYLISNDGTNIIYILFKSINPATSIGVSNKK